MEPGLQHGIVLSDVLTIIGIILALVIQSWAYLRSQAKRAEEQDEAIGLVAKEFAHEVKTMTGKMDAIRDHSRTEIARLDRDMVTLRERLSQMPSRSDMETIIRDRITPLESDLRGLVLQLARLGLADADPIRRGRDQWGG